MKKRFCPMFLVALSLPCASSLIRSAAAAVSRSGRPKADQYQAHLNASRRESARARSAGISRVGATPGNLGVTVLRRNDGRKTESSCPSGNRLTRSRGSRGEDYQKAVILPRDREYLLEVEPTVLHYEILREERKP